MSLVRIAARISAVEALKGRTMVGSNVLNSQIGALEIAADGTIRTDQEKPFISVYADGSKMTGDGTREVAPSGDTEFLFEVGILAAHLARDEETDEAIIVEGIPATDEAFEFHCDLVVRQIADTLNDSQNGWADIFRSLTVRWQATERARVSGDVRGVRLAAHQLKIVATLIADPVRGVELKPGHPLSRFFEMAASLEDAAVDARVALMQAQISGDESAWRSAMRRYGLTTGEAAAMRLTPAADADAIGEVEIVENVPGSAA